MRGSQSAFVTHPTPNNDQPPLHGGDSRRDTIDTRVASPSIIAVTVLGYVAYRGTHLPFSRADRFRQSVLVVVGLAHVGRAVLLEGLLA